MTDWFNNDDLFRRELETGHRWAAKVVNRLQAEGVPAVLTPLVWREDISKRHTFADEMDIIVQTPKGALGLESKSRNLRFTEDPTTYPYSTAFVDTVSGWDNKTNKPYAVVLTSQKTEKMLMIPSRSSKVEWTVDYTYDRVRDIWDYWYEVPRSCLLPFQALIDALHSKLT